jgi:pimeloyl-ACP methyl ester carboxylesterase
MSWKKNMEHSLTPVYHQAYVDKGEGAPVILLNGLFGNLKIWAPVVEALSKEYRVIVPRLPLFDSHMSMTSIKQLVRVLHDFVERHQLSGVTLVGHALGGQAALFYANQHPEVVDKLVLVSSSGLLDKDITSDSGTISPFSFDFINDKVRTAFHHPDEVATGLAKEIYQLVQDAPKRFALASLLQSSLHSSVSTFLSKLDLPVLLIWGLQDQVNPPDNALHFHDLLPNSTVKFIDQCGHLPMIEKPTCFVESIESFMKRK